MTRHAFAHDTIRIARLARYSFPIAGRQSSLTHADLKMIGKLDVYFDTAFASFCRNDQVLCMPIMYALLKINT